MYTVYNLSHISHQILRNEIMFDCFVFFLQADFLIIRLGYAVNKLNNLII